MGYYTNRLTDFVSLNESVATIGETMVKYRETLTILSVHRMACGLLPNILIRLKQSKTYCCSCCCCCWICQKIESQLFDHIVSVLLLGVTEGKKWKVIMSSNRVTERIKIKKIFRKVEIYLNVFGIWCAQETKKLHWPEFMGQKNCNH